MFVNLAHFNAPTGERFANLGDVIYDQMQSLDRPRLQMAWQEDQIKGLDPHRNIGFPPAGLPRLNSSLNGRIDTIILA